MSVKSICTWYYFAIKTMIKPMSNSVVMLSSPTCIIISVN